MCSTSRIETTTRVYDGGLEDGGDQGDADMKTPGAVCEEPVTTIGIDGENLDDCETDEESFVDDVNEGFVDPEMVRNNVLKN